MRERMGERTNKRTNEWMNGRERTWISVNLLLQYFLIYLCACFWLSLSSRRGRDLFGQRCRQFSDFPPDLIWLKILNEHSTHAWKIHSGQRSQCLLLTKRIVASEEEYGLSFARLVDRWIGSYVCMFLCLFVCSAYVPYRIFQGSTLHCCSWRSAGKALEFQDIHKIAFRVFLYVHLGMLPFHMDCVKAPSLDNSLLPIQEINQFQWKRGI